ncbi:hypothetical protein MMC25_000246, partial [Agyrium rufum]|nr:hypothetical protein [Agyrium rufum]
MFPDGSIRGYKSICQDIREMVGEGIRHKLRKENETTLSEAQEKILPQISSRDLNRRQKDLLDDYCSKINRARFDDPPFKIWKTENRQWYLRYFGKQGSGKTMFACGVIQHLDEENHHVVYLFLEDKLLRKASLTALLCRLLKQLIIIRISHQKFDGTLIELRNFLQRQPTSTNQSRSNVVNCLIEQTNALGRVYFVIDALDQCSATVSEELENDLATLQGDRPEEARVMFTTGEHVRHVFKILCDECGTSDLPVYFQCSSFEAPPSDLCQECFEKKVKCNRGDSRLFKEPYKLIQVELKPGDDEIEEYITWRVYGKTGDTERIAFDENKTTARLAPSPLTNICRKDGSVINMIINAILEQGEASLLYARVVMDRLAHVYFKNEVNEILTQFPRKLDVVYKESMQRIMAFNEQDRNLASRILARVTIAHRTLTWDELQHVLAAAADDLDLDRVEYTEMHYVLRATKGLIHISDRESNSILHGVHRSLWGYLDGNWREWFPSAQIDMAIACLNYLDFNKLKAPIPNVEQVEEKVRSRMTDYPFLEYASRYWGDHVRGVFNDVDDVNVKEKALRLLRHKGKLATVLQTLLYSDPRRNDELNLDEGVEPIH